MITTTDTYRVQSTVDGDKIAMGIDVASMGHVMSVLTNLYANKLLAIVREYSSNAYDAQIEAGVDRPIEVTTPNDLSQFLKVRDFGIGLTRDEIAAIYSQYGASTKRATNDQVGMLGLGCKSALTYASQFTLVSIKAGTRIVVAIGRDEDGAGSMTVVDTTTTTDEDGTEVVIPIRREDVRRVQQEAATFFSVWPKNSVRVNGDAPKRFEGLKVSTDTYIVKGLATAQVVMGNVAYPAPQLDGLVDGQFGRVLAFVPIGGIVFPPSREALQDHSTTRATLDRIRAEFRRDVAGVVQREVDAAEDPFEAVQIVLKWRGLAESDAGYTYKGTLIPEVFVLPKVPIPPTYAGQYQQYEWPMRTTRNGGYDRKGQAHNVEKITLDRFRDAVWVKNYSPEKFNAQHKNKMLKAIEGLSPTHSIHEFVLIDPKYDAPDMPFVRKDRILDWEEVKKIRLQPVSSIVSPRLAGSYDLYTEASLYSQSEIAGDDIRQDKPVFYYHGNPNAARYLADFLRGLFPAYTLVCLSANRIDKFKRDVPQVVEVHAAIRAAARKWHAGLPSDTKHLVSLREHGAHVVRSALMFGDPSKVNDPELRRAVKVAKLAGASKDADFYHSLRRTVSDAVPDAKVIEDPLDRYPLFNYRVLQTDPQHVIAYINAAYAAKV